MKATLIIFGLIFLVGCDRDKNTLLGQYYGGWSETLWIVTLHEDNRFEYKIEGHIAKQTITGDFTTLSDTLILNSDNKKFTSEGFKDKKLLITGDSCLIDLEIGYDYCKSRPDEWISKKWNLDTVKPER